MIRKLFSTQLGWAVLAGVAVGAVGMGIFFHSVRPALADPAEPSVMTQSDYDALARIEQAQVKLGEKVMPSVVHLDIAGRGEGSGVIFRADGYILTNAHVVANTSEVTVTFNDGKQEKGKVFADQMSDLAVIKVERKNLRALQFADSEAVKPGQMVVAVGSPFGLQQSITFGHVSAINRSNQWAGGPVGGARPYFDLIQTDAAINPGNSGGPLLSIRGEIVGINTAINTTMGQNSGVGFAIPANMAKAIANALVKDGSVTRAYMGLTPANLLGYEAEETGVAQGAIVRSVEQGAPASNAGLKEGDVIVKIGDAPVRGELDIRNAMVEHKPGEKVALSYVRDGKTLSTQIELASRPDAAQASAPNRPTPPDRVPDRFRDPFGWFGPGSGGESAEGGPTTGPVRLGVSVAPLDEETKSLSPTGKGVLITAVEPGSPAARARVQENSVLLKVGDIEITSPEQLQETVAKFKRGDRSMITLARQTRAGVAYMTVTITF